MKKAAPSNEALVFDFKRNSTLLAWLDTSSAAPKVRAVARIPGDPLLDESGASFRKTLSEWGLAALPRAILTWEDGIIFRQFAFPEMPDEDLKKAFLWEMNQKFAVVGDENVIAYERVAEGEAEDGAKERFYSIFYVERRVASERLKFVRSLGCSVSAIVPGQASLAQLAKILIPDSDKDTLIFDIGLFTARVLVTRDGKNMLSRTVPLGSAALTEALTATFMRNTDRVKFDPEQAEQFKIREGASDPQASHISLVRPWLEKVVAEIKRSVDYYESQKYSRPIGKVLFTGGGSNLKGLDGFMSRFLGLEVFLPDRGAFISTQNPGVSQVVLNEFPTLAAALGAPAAASTPMNLLPEEWRDSRPKITKRASLRVILGVLAGCLALLDAWTFARLSAAKSQLTASEGQWREIGRMRDLLTDLGSQQKFERVALNGDLLHPALLKQISLAVPNEIVLETLEFDRTTGGLTIQGAAGAGSTDVKVIARFISDLLKSPFLKDATLADSGKKDGETKTRFLIRCVAQGIG